MKTTRLVSALMVLALLIVACTGATPAPAAGPSVQVEDEWGVVTVAKGDPIRIGLGAALSGAGLDILGIDEQRGAELAISDKGTIMGFEIELVAEDDVCSAEGGITVANKFVSDPSIVAVVGQMCSSGCLAAMDIYQEHGYTMVSPSCTAVVLTTRGNESFHRVCWNDAIQGPAAAKFLREEVGVETVATVHDGSPYGEGLVNEMAAAFEAAGGTVVAREAVNVGDTDMRPLLERIKSAGPEAIYFGGFVAEGAYLASQRVDVGMEDVVFMGADGILATDFIRAAGEAAEGVYASAANPAEAGAGMEKFLADYEAAYGEKPPAPFHAHAYDAAMVIMNAIEKVAQVDAEGNLLIGRKALNEAIGSTANYQGLSGVITCDEVGNCGTGTVAVSQVRNGAFEVIWPK
ncbi:MAG: branched-chain amino acid ABC transporter substrate-binding protein [Anaerolineae bacterium]|nr:branched-chain amino acid ABC transporter substrate-binding protein [Anaerolineae bacterium]